MNLSASSVDSIVIERPAFRGIRISREYPVLMCIMAYMGGHGERVKSQSRRPVCGNVGPDIKLLGGSIALITF